MLRGFYFNSKSASAKNDAIHRHGWRSISSAYFDKIMERICRRLLLSPQEGALNVLRAAFYQPYPSGNHTVSYFVNGIPAPERLAYSLQHQEKDRIVVAAAAAAGEGEAEGERSHSCSKLSEQMQHCFEDAVRVLPTAVRRSVVHRLQTAASLPVPPSLRMIDPRQRERRVQAMLNLADEINAICDDNQQ